MTKIPPALLKEIDADPAYKSCMLHGHHGHICEGRVTREHVIIFAGKQLQEKWAIIALCARGHEVDAFQDAHTMNKEMNVWCALNRATAAELFAISKAENYTATRDRLNKKYGPWQQNIPLDKAIGHLVAGPGRPIQINLPKKSSFSPSIETQKTLDNIRGFLIEAEGTRYSDAQIIGMAIRSMASELEATREIAG